MNTLRAEYMSQGMNHFEGGWPKDINPAEHDQTMRFRKKIEKDDSYINSVLGLCQVWKICLIPQPWTLWPDLVKFRHLGRLLKIFGKYLRFYLVFGKILKLIWQFFINFWQIWTNVASQIIKNNLAIWSHWP